MVDSYLEKFNPKTPLFEQFVIDTELSQEEKAFATWKALLTAKRNHDGLFLVIGKLLKSCRDERLYQKLDYETFTQFLASEELGFSREKAYMCIKTYEYYIEYLEMDPRLVGTMNISRLSLMVPLLKKIEDKTEAIKQIEAMTQLRLGDFVRELKKQTNVDGKPSVYFSQETDRWIVGYHPDTTYLQDLGNFKQ